MCARLHEPQGVSHHSIFVTRLLLLLPPPLRQFDLVREKIASSQDMSQPKMCPKRPQPPARLLIAPIAFYDLEKPIVVCVTHEPRHTIRRHLVLKVDVRDGRPNI